jgi:general secretion pathway protein A
MYTRFYGLSAKPFNLTPDPKFLYLTPVHREALAQLTFGIKEKKGFIVLTGEVGTGKTTLLQALLPRLDSGTATALVFDSTLPFDGLLEYILEDFGIGKVGESRAQRLMALNNFLIERHRTGQSTVLIIDEAQNLTPPALEHIRLLSNFETPTEKLLQIVLVGQPELKAKLELPALRQLKQRIALAYAIRPLTREETTEYIRTRLKLAGAPDLDVFTESAMRRIAQHSKGVPRIGNMVCDHSLVIGYVDQKRRIGPEIVKQAIDYLDRGMSAAGSSAPGLGRVRLPRLRWGGAVFVAAAVGSATALVLRPWWASYVLELARAGQGLLLGRF